MTRTLKRVFFLTVGVGILLWMVAPAVQAVASTHSISVVLAGNTAHCTDGHGQDGNKNPNCPKYPPSPPPHCTDGKGHDADHNKHCTGQTSSFTVGGGSSTGGPTVGMALGLLALLTTAGIVVRRRRMKSLHL
jgi:hypothetical protein